MTSRPAKIRIVVLVIAGLLLWMSLYLYLPTLPLYVQSIESNLAVVGAILAMNGLWQMLGRFPFGIASDLTGRRRPFVIGGLLLGSIGAWMMGGASTSTELFIGRSLTGISACAWVPLMVAFSSLFKPEEAIKAASLLTLASSVGRILGTAGTGFINEWSGGFQLAFQLASATALIAALLMAFYPEKRNAQLKIMNPDQIGHLVVRPDVLIPTLMSAVLQYGDWAATFSFIPLLAEQFGATDQYQSARLSFNMLMMIAGNFMATPLAVRLGQRRVIVICFLLMAVGVGMAAVGASLGILFASQLFIGLSIGISYPVLMGMSIQQVDESQRSTAMGVHQSVYALGVFGGPWLSGILADAVGIPVMFAITAAAILLAGAGLLQLLPGRRPRKRRRALLG